MGYRVTNAREDVENILKQYSPQELLYVIGEVLEEQGMEYAEIDMQQNAHALFSAVDHIRSAMRWLGDW